MSHKFEFEIEKPYLFCLQDYDGKFRIFDSYYSQKEAEEAAIRYGAIEDSLVIKVMSVCHRKSPEFEILTVEESMECDIPTPKKRGFWQSLFHKL